MEIAQVWSRPTLIVAQVAADGPITRLGVCWGVSMPLPSSPDAPSPQQYACPPTVSAQTSFGPTEIDAQTTPAGVVTAVGDA